MNRLFFVGVFFIYLVPGVCQTRKALSDSVFRIKEVSISGNRIDNFSTGNKIQKIDSLLLAKFSTASLARTLSVCSGVQINSYGIGLSNASLRGTGSSHTAVLWNGFNIQDLLNGGVDFSQIPTGFFDQVKVQYGGNGALFGSGAIGGAIHLNNSLDFDSGFKASLKASLASFSNYLGAADVSYSNSRYSGFIKSYYNNARNNYKYVRTQDFGSPTEELRNAESEQVGILAGTALKINQRKTLEAFFWYQKNDKNIPKTLVAEGIATQNDESCRFSVAWRYIGRKTNTTLRSGYSDTYLYFHEINSKIPDGIHRARSLVNEADLNYNISKNHKVNFGLNYTLERGISNSLEANPQRNRTSAFASYRFTSNNSVWNIVTSIREELLNRTLTPTTYTFGFDCKATNFLKIKGKISKNYRIPSLNDLYWKGWGNPNLKPESGFGQDLGLIFSKQTSLITFQYELSGFSNGVTNWILWHPLADNPFIWKPDNISKVWARGIEQQVLLGINFSDFKITPSLSYSFIRSTKVKADSPNDEAYQKQLIYVPAKKANFSLVTEYREFSLFFGLNYTSKRFIRPDNRLLYASDFVEGYLISDVNISKKLIVRQQQIIVMFWINNLTNEKYEVMQYYPTPLRNYQICIQLNLK